MPFGHSFVSYVELEQAQVGCSSILPPYCSLITRSVG